MSANQRKGLIWAVIIVIVFLFCFPITIVPPGFTGIRVTLGNVNMTPVLSGIYLKPPWFIQQMVKMDCRVQKHDTKAGAASKDLQEVQAEIVVNYKVNIGKSAELFKNVGSDYREIIISPATQESIKAITSQFTAEELITKRSDVSLRIKQLLDNRLEPYGIVVDNFSIVNFDFSKEFNAAIESKQTAQQLALKATQDLIRIKTEAEQKVAQAQAEAESLRLQNQQVTSMVLQLRAIEKWDGKLPTYYIIGSGSQPLFNIPIGEISK